ncbi:MAG TPA: molybdopterin molybdotransferase MoeA [Pyrinomonadaceae bacterium]|nr:molybdopterin molybdotransferase MoeA [Pyrinomonadaceae bacterium]
MISVEKAIKILARNSAIGGTEKIPLAESVGRILAEDVIADMDLPPFDRSQMDGYAVIAKDTLNAPVQLKIVGESAAGKSWQGTLKSGEAVRIMTGAAVPKGADAVQRVEVTSESDAVVTIDETVKRGFSVVKLGTEIRKGKRVINAGERVTENMIATFASFGFAKISVGKQPRVAILATGSEIVDVASKPKRDQIRNSNSPMLGVLCRRFGALPSILLSAKDNISDLKFQISSAAQNSDILIITGGVSVGKYDLTKLALRELEAELYFEKVSLKPGKPTVFGHLGKTLIFGLPGNPVSAAVAFHLFVRPAILRFQGESNTSVTVGNAIISSPIKAARDRDTYLPVSLATDSEARLVATPIPSQGSSDLVSIARANAYAFLKAGTRSEAGDVARIVYI